MLADNGLACIKQQDSCAAFAVPESYIRTIEQVLHEVSVFLWGEERGNF